LEERAIVVLLYLGQIGVGWRSGSVRKMKKQFDYDYETLRPSSRARHSAKNWPDEAYEFPPRPATKTTAVSEELPPPQSTKSTPVSERPVIVRRGHLLSYIGLFIFTVLVYFRPYELIPALKGTSSMAFWVAVVTLIIFVPSQLNFEGRLIPHVREVYLVLFLALFALLSVPFADDPNRAWLTCSDYLKVVVMFIVMVSVVRTPKRLGGLLFLVLAVSCYLGFDAIAKYQAGNFAYDGYRVAGGLGNLFQNPNDLALHLVTIFPIVVGLLLFSRNIFMKLLYAGFGILMLVTIVLTYSRGGFLGLVAGVAVLTWKLQKRHRKSVLAAVIFLGLIFFLLAPNQYGARVASMGGDDSSIARKDDIVRSTIVALRHPLFGIGMDNYVLRSTGNHATHNSYTQVAAEMGIPAGIIYILFLIASLKRLKRIERETVSSRKTQRWYYVAVGLQAALGAYMVSSFFASVAYLWYVYYLVGYAVALDHFLPASPPHVSHNEVTASERPLSQPAPLSI
jgi:probable O-glycosylation ligase (exosortase A-associated)